MAISRIGLNVVENSNTDIGLYIHIPFCNSKCEYCAFVSMVASSSDKKRYFSDLIAELKIQALKMRKNTSISSIYIGGGTPSSMDYYYIRDLLSCIYKNFPVKNSAEITIEINPNTIDKHKIREYILAGVNRFSVGLQSTNPKILKAMGRQHTIADFEKTIKIIREFSIKNISADIIIGYPKQKLMDVKDTVQYLIKMGIPHISAYMLQVESGTKLKKLVDNGSVTVPDDDAVVDMYKYVCSALESAGYNRYELSNFAKPGFESYHNQIYWNRKNYIGLGLAAHSYVNGVRFANTESMPEYAKKIEEKGEIPTAYSKVLTSNEKKEECIMLSLRTATGLDLEAYKTEFNESFLQKRKATVAKLIENEYLILKENHLYCTTKGFLVLNQVILQLVEGDGEQKPKPTTQK